LAVVFGWVFTTALAGYDAVCLGEILGVGVVRCVSIRGLALLDGAYDLIGLPESVADMAQFIAETISVAQEPLLEALHEIPREVGLVLGRVAVFYDLIEPSINELFVAVWRQVQALVVEPGGGPGECLAKNDLVPIKCFGMFSAIKILLDSGKCFLE